MVSAKLQPDKYRFIQATGQVLADQYYHIYNVRLECVRASLVKRARFRWGDEVKNVPLEQLNASLGSSDVFVIGTLFKKMPNQPSILRELEGDEYRQDNPEANFTSDEDSLVLHETDENVQVVGDIDIHSHVTGIPVALLGHQLNGGAKFHVTDVCYAGPILDVYKPKSPLDDKASADRQLLVLVSGLQFGFEKAIGKAQSKLVVQSLRNFRDFIHGRASQEVANGFHSSNVSKVIIAGNSINFDATNQVGETKSLSDVFRTVDRYIFELAQSGAEIVVMPGRNDPTSKLLPQQPFHRIILPQSGSLRNVIPTTNPCLVDHGDMTFLGTSGEVIQAIRQHSRIEYSTTILKSTLEWGHVAPSAPDNLSCVPFKEKDPFVIDFVPDIYFAGNQPEYAVTTYASETKSKIQLISVPSFLESRSCVVVDLANLECELLSF